MNLHATRLATALAAALLVSGCATLVPPVPAAQPQVPQAWPLPEHTTAPAGALDVADIGWREVLVDPRLQRVVAQALDNNRDLRVAVLNVERARAQYRIRRADRVPSVGANGSMERVGGDVPTSESYAAGVGIASFELDLFGRVRSLSQAALESWLATEEGARSTRIALIAEVADAYATLAADKELLEVARQTVASAERSLALTRALNKAGLSGKLDVRQAETVVESARAADFDVLALTVDTIVGGNRERCLRSGFGSPPRISPR